MEKLNKTTTHKNMGLIKREGHETGSSQLKAQRTNHQKGAKSSFDRHHELKDLLMSCANYQGLHVILSMQTKIYAVKKNSAKCKKAF